MIDSIASLSAFGKIPFFTRARVSELGKLESGKRRCRSVSFICLV